MHLRFGRPARLLLAAVISLGVALAALAFTQADEAKADERIDRIFAAWDHPGSPGCALGVMRRGALVYQRGYGAANLEYGLPIRPASIFHVASLSKQFTGAAIALLAADGKLSLDDDVRKYVPEVPDFGKTITLRQLAQHTSGLRDQWDLLALAGWRWEADVVTTADVLDITSRQTALNFEPGAEYLYSNTGYTLLGVVVERVSGKPLREFARERIFEPLGMKSTHFHDDHQMVVKDRAYAYAPSPDGGWRQSIPDFDTVGATSLFTTVQDLARWDRNFSSQQVGGPALAALQTHPGVLTSGASVDYTLGLLRGEYRGLAIVEHGGADAGYRADFLRFPDEALSIAVLCNFPASDPGELARKVAGVYLAGRLKDPQPEQPPDGVTARATGLTSDEVRLLEGVYVEPATDLPTRLVAKEGRLYLARGQEQLLLPDGPRRFRTANGAITVEVVSIDGWPIRLRVSEETGHVANLQHAAEVENPAALEAYVGTYHSDELGTDYVVERAGDGLSLVHRKLGVETLRQAFKDGFRYGGRALTFARDADGRVTGFTLSTPRVRKVRFVRRPGGRELHGDPRSSRPPRYLPGNGSIPRLR